MEDSRTLLIENEHIEIDRYENVDFEGNHMVGTL